MSLVEELNLLSRLRVMEVNPMDNLSAKKEILQDLKRRLPDIRQDKYGNMVLEVLESCFKDFSQEVEFEDFLQEWGNIYITWSDLMKLSGSIFYNQSITRQYYKNIETLLECLMLDKSSDGDRKVFSLTPSSFRESSRMVLTLSDKKEGCGVIFYILCQEMRKVDVELKGLIGIQEEYYKNKVLSDNDFYKNMFNFFIKRLENETISVSLAENILMLPQYTEREKIEFLKGFNFDFKQDCFWYVGKWAVKYPKLVGLICEGFSRKQVQKLIDIPSPSSDASIFKLEFLLRKVLIEKERQELMFQEGNNSVNNTVMKKSDIKKL